MPGAAAGRRGGLADGAPPGRRGTGGAQDGTAQPDEAGQARGRRPRTAAQPGGPRGPAHGRLQVRLVTTDGELDAPSLAAALAAELGEHLSGVLWTRSRQLAETTAGGETELVWGDAELPERLGELDLRISPEAFFQTNTEMAEVLYGIATEFAALEGWERVYDLYCGIGTIALALAPRAGEVWGIELVEPAVADAIAAAQRNEIANAHFFAGDARLALPELLARAGRPDVLVVDPPAPGSPRKWCAASSRPPRSESSTSPATPPPSRPTPRNWSRPVGRCAGWGPWTCFRRPTMWSVWRCWSVPLSQTMTVSDDAQALLRMWT